MEKGLSAHRIGWVVLCLLISASQASLASIETAPSKKTSAIELKKKSSKKKTSKKKITKAKSGDPKCADLVEHLRSMQKAQSSLLQTMVRKNDSMAETLDLYADRLNSGNGTVKKNDITGIRRSAQSFRKHSSREENIVKKFEDTTQQVLARVEKCLQKESVAVQ